jgi:hypothetical protein
MVRRRTEHDPAIAHVNLGHALLAPGGRLLLALLRLGALPRHIDARLALHRALSDRREEIEFVVGGAVMLGAHQQIHAACVSLLVKQLEDVCLAIHHADRARIG